MRKDIITIRQVRTKPGDRDIVPSSRTVVQGAEEALPFKQFQVLCEFVPRMLVAMSIA